ncbi:MULTISPECIES: hypothetical protein [Streptomyces]|uniref:Uncharacterized protein n=1 Tax=Streptomyces lasiicapitis TaxID=1923961 RepID=A0ABQ2LWV3_9ACTN|nr:MULTISPECIES: hypothetical protein [Streptomyces]QIB44849.1 hypothetical protein G3H79_18955 [Streptomyces aureoverticillatus]GGO43812.1 hypothetical protein GCM10012286_28570 [Streptomyces lasiicapitis]
MAHNPHAPQGAPGPEGQHDPAGSTQMFRAFVDETPQGGRAQRQAPAPAGPRIGLILGVVAAVVIVAAVAWLALK